MPHLPSVVNIASMKSTLVLLTTLLSINVAHGASKAELNAKTLEGQKVHLKDLRGKLVVLNFWATWCGPCREELPMLVKAAQAAGQPDLVFIAVSVDDSKTEGKVPDAVRQFGISFPVWRGATGDDVFKLSKGEAVPATVFIDRDGTIESRVSGTIRESELTERIKWLTGDRKGSKPQDFISHVN
jgi:thiol-disulfide isomerase/thioredoxin